MKMLEEIKGFKKEFVHDGYSRIVLDFKDYDKITKAKMIEAIYKVYSDYKNIIDICTVRELKYLEMIIKGDINTRDEEHRWERNQLRSKFLICDDFRNIYIPEEIEENVKKALENVNWNVAKRLDNINEILVGYCKIQGSSLLPAVASIGSIITGVSEDDLITHMYHNKVFNFYVCVFDKHYDSLGDVTVLLHNDYYHLFDEIEEARKAQAKATSMNVDEREYRTLFYNDFNINKPIIKKLLEELHTLPFFSHSAIKPIREYALLNLNRESLKESIKGVPALEKVDLTDFFKLMDEAMDEMPSGALNGLTPNEYKKVLKEEREVETKKEKRYVRQRNACLSKKEANLFYKIYFALLEFTNDKYKIKPGFKIYQKNGINPRDISEIVEKYWANKDLITLEFCMANPYKFDKEEMKMASEFKKGVRDEFIIVEYQEDYTAVMSKDRVYMIKGINSNIDEVVSYKDLPYMTRTSIIPFGDKLIYDGIFLSYEIDFGLGFNKAVEREYSTAMKYYHL